jgi:hypothetical protein
MRADKREEPESRNASSRELTALQPPEPRCVSLIISGEREGREKGRENGKRKDDQIRW